jgi:hypothetical protein
MSKPDSRRALKGKIREVADALHRHWDPIGSGVPADEYDSYAPAVTGMIERGKTDRDIATHLAEIEQHAMLLQPRPIPILERIAGDIRRAVSTNSHRAT